MPASKYSRAGSGWNTINPRRTIVTVDVELSTLEMCFGNTFPPLTRGTSVVQERNTRNAVVQAAILFM
jgi:hypothetical protein